MLDSSPIRPAGERHVRSDQILFVSGVTVRTRQNRFLRSGKFSNVLEDVNLHLAGGTALGIVGPSGAGKSTLARTIVGLSPFATGSVKFDGTEILELSASQLRPLRKDLQLVLQNVASLSPYHTVSEILTQPLSNFGIEESEWRLRRDQVTEQFCISASLMARYPDELSGGQQQRVSIARALILRPRLVVFDEPVSSLDRIVQRSILDSLKERQTSDEMSYLMITHDRAVAEYCCQEIATLDDGKLRLDISV